MYYFVRIKSGPFWTIKFVFAKQSGEPEEYMYVSLHQTRQNLKKSDPDISPFCYFDTYVS